MNAISPTASETARMRRAMSLGTDNMRSGSEMAVAAGQVIAHRMGLGMAAIGAPHAADHAEFARMMPEKLEAFTHAGAALVRPASRAGETMVRYAVDEAVASSKAMLALSHARSPLALAAVQASYAHSWFSRAMSQCLSLGVIALQAQSAALAPIHRTATQNAKRLSR